MVVQMKKYCVQFDSIQFFWLLIIPLFKLCAPFYITFVSIMSVSTKTDIYSNRVFLFKLLRMGSLKAYAFRFWNLIFLYKFSYRLRQCLKQLFSQRSSIIDVWKGCKYTTDNCLKSATTQTQMVYYMCKVKKRKQTK